MTTRSPTASRALVCLVTLLVCGVGTVGIVAATGGSASLEADDSPAESVDVTDDEFENASGDLETDDGRENATNGTGDEDDGTDEIRNATDGSDDTVDETEDALENGTETATNTTDETRDAVDTVANETADGGDEITNDTTETVDRLLDDSSGAIDGDAELDGSIGTGPVDLEAAASVSTESSESADDDDSNAASGSDNDGTGGASAVPGGTSTTADAVLVGLLGTVTAAGAAAGSASGAGGAAGAGASAGAAAGSAGGAGSAAGGTAAGGATGFAAKWLGQSSVLQYLRRIGSLVPWNLVSIFRYSRYDDSDPLENDRRRTIYETIADDPGCYLSAVSDQSGVALSTVRHHVRVLEEEGLVATAKVNGKRRYFLEDDRLTADESAVADVALHAALAEPAKREVLETLAALGSAPNGRLADELERDPSTVSHHLSALEEDGLVVREKDGRSVVNELVPAVETTLRSENAALEDVSAETSASAPADD
ncbi:transcriptional regulator, MarR family [Haloterrigena turkmenica DSM 5511]|uniref:Transcriptional regulator, MarR family n=1 Tax=Haloterrigena turkmenica (strain ATCC 51198 / DSM 5511 / JCM 9101 / NCIMB 13204 / VKM B-1734 / 4k) TaxID=543526 RepID=D2RV56_HALTV|nr:helix-turn-helix domain-containing protein [Haloterrigena turkmenica]ADB61257.1 transcriptional regulator, MarR family [Haloterrigena turkmenica DSM 5511]